MCKLTLILIVFIRFCTLLSVFALVWGFWFLGIHSMTVHTDIYKLCTAQPQAFSEQLYHRLKRFLEEHVDRMREVFSSNPYPRYQFASFI
jgi:hypothetical protein